MNNSSLNSNINIHNKDKAVFAFIVFFSMAFFLAAIYPKLQADSLKEIEPLSEPIATPAGLLKSLALIDPATVQSRKTDIKHWKTSNGARVLFFYSPEIPILDVRLIFNAGSTKDKDIYGLASLTSKMIGEGTKNKTVDEIERGFESIGANFSTSSYRDMAIIKLRTLTNDQWFERAMDLFTEVISMPSFPEESFSRIIQQNLVTLEYEKQSPGTLLKKSYYNTLYPGHPYGTPVNGNTSTINSISIEDIKTFYKTYYVANNLVIAIVGSVEFTQAKALSERISLVLATGQNSEPVAPIKAQPAIKTHIDYPSEQTHIMIGLPVVEKGHEDYVPLFVGNDIFGGSGLTSQLSRVIRDDHGLAYSVYSYFSPMEEKGPFTIAMQTKNASADQALILTYEELDKFIEQGPTQEQLKNSKQHILGSFPLSVSSNSSISGYLGSMGFYNLPIDYLDTFTKKVSEVTIEDVKRVYKKYIIKDKLNILTIGSKISNAPEEPILEAPDISNSDESEKKP